MGCAASKLDELPAVVLCRDRKKFMDQALRQAEAFADAHVAYLESLRILGPSLSRFFEIGGENCNSPQTRSSLGAGSHLQFPSDSESEDDADRNGDQDFTSSSGVVLNSHFAKTPLLPPPPPPPPAVSSTWDFLNLFDDVYERYESIYVCNSDHDSDRKIENKIDNGVKNGVGNVGEERESVLEENKSNAAATPETTPCVEVEKGVAEAMTELELQFKRASESGNEVLKLLSHSHHHKIYPECRFDQEDLAISSQSLAYTLKTLFLWEKKLYDEVKAEELLRITHEKKSKMLKQFDKKDADTAKVDSIHKALGSLSTKMRIAIQIVDRISGTINKLRDEEMWPQIIELVGRLLDMWKCMAECHKCQYQAIAEAKNFDTSYTKYSNDTHLETVIQLKIDLHNWNSCFSNWIATQKGCVKALNSWLLRCLMSEPQQTQEDAVPMSPGTMGAPSVFVICNHWSQAMDRLSEKEVIEANQGFQTSIDLILEQHNVELQQWMIENNDHGRRVKLLEEQQQKLHKLMQAGRGKLFGLLGGEEGKFVLPGERVQVQSENSSNKSRNVECDLKQSLMAMEKFTENTMKEYKELHEHIEQVRHAGKTETNQ